MIGWVFHVLREYRKWRGNWDALCDRCGLCCYRRQLTESGEVVVELSSPCRFLNEETHLCKVYDSRFSKAPYCRRIGLMKALFNKTMPPSCAYVRTFRRRGNAKHVID